MCFLPEFGVKFREKFAKKLVALSTNHCPFCRIVFVPFSTKTPKAHPKGQSWCMYNLFRPNRAQFPDLLIVSAKFSACFI